MVVRKNPPDWLVRGIFLYCEWILARIELSGWKRRIDVVNAQQVQGLEKYLAHCLEGVCTVVWEALAYQHVAVEPCEAWDGSYAYAMWGCSQP